MFGPVPKHRHMALFFSGADLHLNDREEDSIAARAPRKPLWSHKAHTCLLLDVKINRVPSGDCLYASPPQFFVLVRTSIALLEVVLV